MLALALLSEYFPPEELDQSTKPVKETRCVS